MNFEIKSLGVFEFNKLVNIHGFKRGKSPLLFDFFLFIRRFEAREKEIHLFAAPKIHTYTYIIVFFHDSELRLLFQH